LKRELDCNEIEEALLSPEFFANPYPFYQILRSATPIYWSDKLGTWIFTRYSDCVSGLRDPSLLSNAGRMTALLDQLPEAARQNLGLLYEHYSAGLIFSDPPDHTRLRALVNKAFTPAVVEGLRPRIQEIVEELIDGVQYRGTTDIIGDLAYPLPAMLISELFELPPRDRDQFRIWSEDIIALLGAGADAARAERGQRSLRALREYFVGLIAQRRHKPDSDVISALIAAREQGDRLSEAELLSTCVTLLTASQETTTNLIGNGVLALLRNPDQLEKLRDDPSLITTAVEELLRYDAPLQRALRRVTETFEVDGERIEKGELVSLMLGAANRDPNQFPDPDRLNISRQENRHIGFGYGIHFCLGGPLARIEGQIAISALLRRLPSLRLASEELEWRQDVSVRGLRALPVVF